MKKGEIILYMGIKKQYKNLPTDIEKSLSKLSKIINLVEENLENSKEYILKEIIMEFGDLQMARKLFSLYYPVKGVSLSRYILERKKKNSSTKALDVTNLANNMNLIYENLEKFGEEGYLKAEVVRTKIRISDMDWNYGLKIIFSMREYIDVLGEKNINSILNYDFFLQYYDWMDDYIQRTDNYDPFHVLDYYTTMKAEFDKDMQIKVSDFKLYYEIANKIIIKDLTYYICDRKKYKTVINNFTLPLYLKDYVSILHKTRSTLKLLSRKGKDDQVFIKNSMESYKKEFEKLIDDDLEKMVFDYFSKLDNKNNKDTIENIYQDLRKIDEILNKEDVVRAIKNLLLKGFISLK